MGMPMSDITSVRVALNAIVSVPTDMALGKARLADARMTRTVDEPMRNRMNVLAVQISKFRLLCDRPVSVDNLGRSQAWLARQYLGKMVPTLSSRR